MGPHCAGWMCNCNSSVSVSIGTHMHLSTETADVIFSIPCLGSAHPLVNAEQFACSLGCWWLKFNEVFCGRWVFFNIILMLEIAAGKISFNLKTKTYFQAFEMKTEMAKSWITPKFYAHTPLKCNGVKPVKYVFLPDFFEFRCVAFWTV